MRDRKVGYHWIWMLPMYWCMSALTWTINTFQKWILQVRIKYLEHTNPELKRIRKLSGITKHD